MNLLAFAIGAAIGAPLRFWLDQKFRSRHQFPTGIFIANVVGSFVIGFELHAADSISTYLILGFCGALTTWSTFILDLYLANETGRVKTALLNLVTSLAVGYAAVLLSIQLAS